MNAASVQSDVNVEYKSNAVVQWAICQWYECMVYVSYSIYTLSVLCVHTGTHAHTPP